jgi:hypothetical protein
MIKLFLLAAGLVALAFPALADTVIARRRPRRRSPSTPR